MSDVGRKDLSSKVEETVKPQSEKSYAEQAKEAVTDKYDQFARKAQPEDQKSYGQSIGDAVQQGKDKATGEETLSDQAAEYLKSGQAAVPNLAEQGKSALSGAAEYISGTATGAKEGAKEGADATKK